MTSVCFGRNVNRSFVHRFGARNRFDERQHFRVVGGVDDAGNRGDDGIGIKWFAVAEFYTLAQFDAPGRVIHLFGQARREQRGQRAVIGVARAAIRKYYQARSASKYCRAAAGPWSGLRMELPAQRACSCRSRKWRLLVGAAPVGAAAAVAGACVGSAAAVGAAAVGCAAVVGGACVGGAAAGAAQATMIVPHSSIIVVTDSNFALIISSLKPVLNCDSQFGTARATQSELTNFLFGNRASRSTHGHRAGTASLFCSAFCSLLLFTTPAHTASRCSWVKRSASASS